MVVLGGRGLAISRLGKLGLGTQGDGGAGKKWHGLSRGARTVRQSRMARLGWRGTAGKVLARRGKFEAVTARFVGRVRARFGGVNSRQSRRVPLVLSRWVEEGKAVLTSQMYGIT